jgi:tRNA U34 5-methylaminomethyl-2-thiouridine-forming methyltransferase MnmC
MPTPTATEAIIGKGSTISYSAWPTPATYTTVAKIKDFKPSAPEVGKAEVTAFDDDSEQQIAAWWKQGDAEFELIYLTASTTALQALIGVMQTWKITLPDTHAWIGAGFISQYEPTVPLKQGVTEKIKITPTGKWVYT